VSTVRGRIALVALVAALLAAGTAAATSAEIAAKAPEIAGTTLGGKRLSLSWYRSRTVFLNLWASW
jgi:hypothetical protein